MNGLPAQLGGGWPLPQASVTIVIVKGGHWAPGGAGVPLQREARLHVPWGDGLLLVGVWTGAPPVECAHSKQTKDAWEACMVS